MLTTRTLTIILAVLALTTTAACRDKNGSDNPDGGGGDGGGGGDTTIQEVQNDSMPVGTAVNLRGVVVISIDTYGGRTGSIHVMEPGGGAFSGVQVFLNGTQAAGLAVGDLVDVLGAVKDEFALSDDTTGRTLTQLEPPQGGAITVTKTGTGTVPAPEVVNPWDLAADDAEAEKWEGVLIQFNDVAVLSAPRNVTQTDPLLKEMDITGPFPVSSSLTALADTIMRDDCYASIVGIGDYFFDYKLLPRSAADLTAGGTNCPAQEAGDTDCADEADNDYDGFVDCADFSCQDSVAACVTDTTVVDIQNETVTFGSAVNLVDVVVTGVDFRRKNLWVADASAGAQYNGILVFRGFGSASELPANIMAGATIDVRGRVASFENVTQIADPVITFKSAGADNGTPVTGLDAATLNDDTTGEPYEGVIVQIGASQVTQMSAGFNGFIVNDGTGDIVIDGDIDAYTPASATECYSSITGILHVDEVPVDSDTYRRAIEIRGDADVVTTACP